jgi:hypothetical protein
MMCVAVEKTKANLGKRKQQHTFQSPIQRQINYLSHQIYRSDECECIITKKLAVSVLRDPPETIHYSLLYLEDREKKDQCFVATLLVSGRFGSGLPCEASLSLLCSYSYRHFVNVRAPFLLSRRPKRWSPVDMLEHFQLSVVALATSWKP